MVAWLRTLPDHRLLDRLIGGRIWIVLLGGLLVGIVTMQLSLLRLNAGIGQAVERGGKLEQRNAALRLSISQLSDSKRIVGLATQMGYVTPPQGSPRFLSTSDGDAAKALTTMRVPDPATVTAAAVVPVTSTTDPAVTTTDGTADPSTTTATDATATTTTDPATGAVVTAPPADTTTASAPTTGTTTAPPADTTAATAAPTTAAPVPTAGGASVPVEGQG